MVDKKELNIVQDEYEVVRLLSEGIEVDRFEYGDSMTPIALNGQYCHLIPCEAKDVEQGDAVFCEIGNGIFLTHMVWAKNKATNQCLIGSTSGHLNGWTDKIYAKAIPIDLFED